MDNYDPINLCLADLSEDAISIMNDHEVSGFMYIQEDNMSKPPCAFVAAESPEEVLQLLMSLIHILDSADSSDQDEDRFTGR